MASRLSVFFGGDLCHGEEVGNAQKRGEGIGDGMTSCIADISGGAFAEVLIFSLQIEVFFLNLSELQLEFFGFRKFRFDDGAVIGIYGFAAVESIGNGIGILILDGLFFFIF